MYFRCLVREDIPYTAGVMRPLEVIAPSGLVVSAQPPAAMAAGNVETSQRITDVVLARAGESRAGADSRRKLGNHEQSDLRRMGSRARTRVRLLRNHRRRHGRVGGVGWRERHAHPHDQQLEHAGGGVRTSVSAAHSRAIAFARDRAARASIAAAMESFASTNF